MGADLIIGVLEMPGSREPNWKAAKAAISAVCRSPKRLREVYKTAEQISAEENGATLADIKSNVRYALAVVEAAWSGERRDWAYHRGAFSTLLITGGESWGDTVGGLEQIEYLWASGAAKAAGFVFHDTRKRKRAKTKK